MAQPYVTGPAHFFVGKVLNIPAPPAEDPGPVSPSYPSPQQAPPSAPTPQLGPPTQPQLPNIAGAQISRPLPSFIAGNVGNVQIGTSYLWSAAKGLTGSKGTDTLQTPAAAPSQGLPSPQLRVYYLGTTETTPRLLIRPYWRPILSDLNGEDVPYDDYWAGEDALVEGVFNRYNEPTLALIQTRPGLASPTRGLHGALDYGGLMSLSGGAWTLFVLFPFAASQTSAGISVGGISISGSATFPNSLAGYRFPGARLAGPDDFLQLGTRHRKNGLAFRCLPVVDTLGNSCLYDHLVPPQLIQLVN